MVWIYDFLCVTGYGVTFPFLLSQYKMLTIEKVCMHGFGAKIARWHLVGIMRKGGDIVNVHRADLRGAHVKRKVAVGRRRTGKHLKRRFPVRQRKPPEMLTRNKKKP
jgi:hypothetical protein